jgi:hypothetical protein
LVLAKRDVVAGHLPEEDAAAFSKGFETLLPLAGHDDVDLRAEEAPDGTILLVPTEDRFDELAAELLIRTMPEYHFTKVPAFKLAGEVMDEIEASHPDLLCVVDVAPGPAAEFRQIAKRVQTRHPELKTVFSRLGMHSARRIQSLSDSLKMKAAVSFTETRNFLIHLSRLERREPPPQVPEPVLQPLPARN